MDKYGSDLDGDTPVYIQGYTYRRSVVYGEVEIKMVSARDFSHILFRYEPTDGLWATYGARYAWLMSPSRHPHQTLFQIILLKNPELLKI